MVNLPSWHPVVWIRSSKGDLSRCPANIKNSFGHALNEVQFGRLPRISRPLASLGPGVFELREWDRSGTYRLVYAVKLIKAVYVLHVFQKKSKHGIAISRADIALIEARRLDASAD
jgi:phage-related protein